MVWDQFWRSLGTRWGSVTHVHMGDLFDAPVLSYDLIVDTAEVYRNAARNNRLTRYVILKGNHDYLRDLERLSAFDLFALLVKSEPNIIIVTQPTVIDHQAFFAYDPVNSAADLVEATNLMGVTEVFGHWDIDGFGSDHNVVPTQALLAAGIKRAWTGHVHKPTVFSRHSVEVNVVGSMQPFAFGEQADDSLYVEHTLDTLRVATDLKQKVVRATLKDGETVDFDVDCLQLVQKRENTDGDDIPVVTLGDFNMEQLFLKAFTEARVSDDVTKKLLGSYNDRRLSTSD